MGEGLEHASSLVGRAVPRLAQQGTQSVWELTLTFTLPVTRSYGALGYEQLYLKESGAPGILVSMSCRDIDGCGVHSPSLECLTLKMLCVLPLPSHAQLASCWTLPVPTFKQPAPSSAAQSPSSAAGHGPAGGHLHWRDARLCHPGLVAAQAG